MDREKVVYIDTSVALFSEKKKKIRKNIKPKAVR